jgi:hypothetical protein
MLKKASTISWRGRIFWNGSVPPPKSSPAPLIGFTAERQKFLRYGAG